MKLQIFHLFFIVSMLILNTKCEKFRKIKEMLQNSIDNFKAEKSLFENNQELEKSEILKEILAKPLFSMNYHSTITEYIGVKYQNIQKFIDHLIKVFSIVNSKQTVEEGIMDLFISDSNDIVVDKMFVNMAHTGSSFICFMGERINDSKDSNWIVIELMTNYFLQDQISVVKTKDSSLFGHLQYERTTHIEEIGKMSGKEIDLLFQYFQFISLQRALEYFDLTS